MYSKLAHYYQLFSQKYPWALRFIVVFWAFIVLGIMAILLFTDLPSFKQLENPKNDQASVIYDIHGVPFGRYFVENRVPVPFGQLSPHIVNATIFTEDDRFFKHSGIDFKAVFRVGVKTVLLGQKSSGGGSTISQQLAKLLFKRPNLSEHNKIVKLGHLIIIKLKEWVTAVRLERNFTKEEILAMYLNQFEFINGAHGIFSASQIYFGKDQKDLQLQEAATLVGMLQNPSLYNPRRFPKRCEERRNIVLEIMYKNQYITKNKKDSLVAMPLDMSSFKTSTQSEGPAPYFRAELTKFIKNLFEKENIRKSDGSEYNIYTDGLKIYTTIDLTYQKYAEEVVLNHMKWNQQRLFNTWKNKDPWTYEADEYQKKLRLKMLETKNKGSERYLKLREKHLSEILKKCEDNFEGLSFSDNAIQSLDSIQNFGKKMSNLEFFENYNPNLQKSYNRFLQSSYWQTLKTKYDELQKVYKKVFSTPLKMKVFDYTENFEKEVEMTPFDSVRYHAMFLQTGVLGIDPVSGHIKAWVGGINHKYFKFDHVTMRRSVGSTIKPMVYTQAMAVQGISPCQEFDDIQYTINPGDANFEVNMEWSPANATEKFTRNKYNLYHGLLYSKNSITVKLVKEMGSVAPIRSLLSSMGIPVDLRLPNGSLSVPNLPSICLGAVDLTPLELTGAYTTFANNGTFSKPIFITKIEDNNGKIIYTGISEKKPAINTLYNAVMVDMLKNNVSNRFTMNVASPSGGKTGTTNDYTDAWFMGITPNLVIGVWTGADDKWVRFLSLDDGEGFINARPIAIKLLQALEKDTSGVYDKKSSFPKPPSGFEEIINCEKFKQVSVSGENKRILKEKLKNEEFDDEF
ncbi:MAG: transglycosylase domain-containing protein [Saprospiraceae bacterium]|nr:transglycosylase domain-containing protein [Saprospiraceae bacterium]MBK6566053.1 transglycosylase domain-containing protein [Saprospiraceae bacterium]MBK7525773.1 transglycosylase domain-containing protein [Saprospiraceae bacterium]MBK8369929.1 transglycosylase domain-containing protein [Saprospiraceae bacterium]MBK8819134.1 transglycosylase domain-containing protein [Saprospiraceae bacterium]